MTQMMIHPAFHNGAAIANRILALVGAEGDNCGNGDVYIASSPISYMGNDDEPVMGWVFTGGSEYGEFELTAVITHQELESGKNLAVTLGRKTTFDANNKPITWPIEASIFGGIDITPEHLAEEKWPTVWRFEDINLNLVAELLYSLFTTYGFSIKTLEEEFNNLEEVN